MFVFHPEAVLNEAGPWTRNPPGSFDGLLAGSRPFQIDPVSEI